MTSSTTGITRPVPELEPTEFDMHEVVKLVEAQGIAAFVMQTGGGCQSIFAGPSHIDAEGDERHVVICGVGSGTMFSEIAVGDFTDFSIGRDDNGVSDDFVCTDETWTVQMIADEIVKRAKA